MAEHKDLPLDEAFDLAVRRHEAGHPGEAVAIYRRILEASPDHHGALHYLGVAARQAGRNDEAVRLMRRAIEIKPDYTPAHNNLGVALQEDDRFDEAAASYRRALELNPDYAEAHNNLGTTLKEFDQYDEAEACYRRALDLKPDYAAAYNNLGIVLRELHRPEEAMESYRRALDLKPDYMQAYNNRAIVLGDLNRLDDAIEDCNRALALDPDYVEAHTNLANTWLDQGRLEEAVAGYDRAIALEPDHAEAHLNKSMALLLAGRYAEGWVEYDWRWKCRGFPTTPPDYPQPVWDGSALDGKTIVLYPEQGLGDAIQFARYVPLVAARGGRVLLSSFGPLSDLMESVAGVARVVTVGQNPPPFEVHAPLQGLPRLFGTTLESIPAEVPYMRVDPAQVTRWAERLAPYPGLKVGLVWAGSPKYKNDRDRSIALDTLRPLFDVAGVSFFTLQFPVPGEELARAGGAVTDLGAEVEKFSDTAAALENLDLLISVDTVAAHLAGALGRRCWVLLPHSSDWRWLQDREDSPWYPKHRLFRQTERGAWGPVVARVRDELKALVDGPDTNGEPVKIAVTRGPNQKSSGQQLQPEARKAFEAALALEQAGRLDEATDAYRRALTQGDFLAGLINLGLVLKKSGRLDEAADSYGRALAMDTKSARARTNLANLLVEQGRLEDAIAEYDRSIALRPEHAETHVNKSLTLLLAGRYEEAWPEYEWRWRNAKTPPPDYPQPAWDGGALDGRTILLYAEQGLGDALQFVRYAPLVAARGGRVVLECRPRILQLFTGVDGVAKLMFKGKSPPPFDCHAALLSLPRIFGTTLATIPAEVPYLRADPALVASWAKRLGPRRGLRVGLVWAGDTGHPGGEQRALPLESLQPWFDLAGVTFYSLQFGGPAQELARVGGGAVTDLGPEVEKFADTAAALENLDLLISVDTAAAHLAGALGRKCWVLLPRVPDWRWHMDREDSPWYPTHRLFRQTERGAWGPVVARVCDELDALASAGGS